jgi:hypothetical protein
MNYFVNKLNVKHAAEAEEAEAKAAGVAPKTALQGNASFSDATGEQPSGFKESKGFGSTEQVAKSDKQTMREGYGWAMNDAQFASLQESETKYNEGITKFTTDFDTDIGDYRTTTNTAIAAEEAAYKKQLGTFNSEVSSMSSKLKKAKPNKTTVFNDWWKKNSMDVRVTSRSGKVEATYRVPKDTAKEYLSKMNGTYKGGKVYVSVRQDGHTVGKELHSSLRGNSNTDTIKGSFWSNSTVKKAWSKGVKSYDKSVKAFNTSRGEGQTSLGAYRTKIDTAIQDRDYTISEAEGRRDNGIATAKADREGKFAAATTAYEKRTANRRSAYKALGKMGNK